MSLIENLARIIVLVFALVLHEIAHAVVALWNGDPTAKNMGRISLNPIRHFDIIGFLMLLFLRFGYGKPVVVNPYNYKRRKLGIFTVAIAGVTVNLLLLFIFTGIFVAIAYYSAVFYINNFFVDFIYYIINYSIIINIYLCVFNLLPIYPLDGFRVIESFAKYNNPYVVFMRKYGQYIILALFAISIISNNFLPSLLMDYPYLDILGYTITTVANGIITPFMKFFQLILGVG